MHLPTPNPAGGELGSLLNVENTDPKGSGNLTARIGGRLIVLAPMALNATAIPAAKCLDPWGARTLLHDVDLHAGSGLHTGSGCSWIWRVGYGRDVGSDPAHGLKLGTWPRIRHAGVDRIHSPRPGAPALFLYLYYKARNLFFFKLSVKNQGFACILGMLHARKYYLLAFLFAQVP